MNAIRYLLGVILSCFIFTSITVILLSPLFGEVSFYDLSQNLRFFYTTLILTFVSALMTILFSSSISPTAKNVRFFGLGVLVVSVFVLIFSLLLIIGKVVGVAYFYYGIFF